MAYTPFEGHYSVAHKLATIFYNALRYGRPYIDKGAEAYELQNRIQAEKS